MKTFTFLKQALLVLFCGVSSLAMAQTNVSTFGGVDGFDAVFQDMKTSGGGTINLTANITVPLTTDQVYSISSTAGNTIIINAGANRFIANGQNSAATIVATNAFLEVGDNVEIYGTGTQLISTSNRGSIRIAGGLVKSAPTANASTVLYTEGNGFIEITGGKVSMDATGRGGNPTVMNLLSSMQLNVTGGTIEYINTGGNIGARILRIAGNSTANLSNVTFDIQDNGTTAYVLYAHNTGGKINIGSGVTIDAPKSTAFYADNHAGAIITIEAGATDLVVNAATEYGLGTNGAIFDLTNPFTISASQTSGHEFAAPDAVTFTLQNGDAALASRTNIYYTLDGSEPTGTSFFIASGGTIGVNESGTIKVQPGKNGQLIGTSQTFDYTVQTVDPAHPVTMVADFAGLKDAFEKSQLSEVVSAIINIGADIIYDQNFDMIAVKPVTINCGTYKIRFNGATATLGGTLIINGNSVANSDGMIYAGANSNITFIGGTYSTTTGSTLTQLSAATAVMTINGGDFTVEGTTTSAKAFQLSATGSQLIFNDGTLTVGNGGRGFHLNCGGSGAKLAINGGTLIVGGAGQIVRLEGVGTHVVEINGGTINYNTGNLVGYAAGTSKGSVAVKYGTITGTGTLCVFGMITDPDTERGADQYFYDFRGLEITATTGTNTMTLSLPTAITPDPVDAVDAIIRYTTDGTVPTATSLEYNEAISGLTKGQEVQAVVEKDGFTSKVYSFTYSVETQNALIESEAGISIAGNILYLANDNQRVQVYKINGTMLVDTIVSGKTFDLSTLNNGVYLVKAGNSTLKFVK